jgi:hypothetical protein
MKICKINYDSNLRYYIHNEYFYIYVFNIYHFVKFPSIIKNNNFSGLFKTVKKIVHSVQCRAVELL